MSKALSTMIVHGKPVSLVIKRDDSELPSELDSRRILFSQTSRKASFKETAKRFKDRCYYVTWYGNTEPGVDALHGVFKSLGQTISLTRNLARSGPTTGIQWMRVSPAKSQDHPMNAMHVNTWISWPSKANWIAAELQNDPASFWELKFFSESDRTSGSLKGAQEVTDWRSWLNSRGEMALEKAKKDAGLSVESSALHYKLPSGDTSRDDPPEHTSTEAGDEQEWSDNTDVETKSTS